MTVSGKRILIIEDEFIIALDLASHLADAGAKVVGPARTIDAALAITDTAELDGAILDIDLGGQVAFIVADTLAARYIPFVFVTAMEPREVPARHAKVPWLQKPFAPGVVLLALASAMHQNSDQKPDSEAGHGSS